MYFNNNICHYQRLHIFMIIIIKDIRASTLYSSSTSNGILSSMVCISNHVNIHEAYHDQHQGLHQTSFKDHTSSSYSIYECSTIKVKNHQVWVQDPGFQDPIKPLVTIQTTNDHRMGHLAHSCHTINIYDSLMDSIPKLSCHQHLYSTFITPLPP